MQFEVCHGNISVFLTAGSCGEATTPSSVSIGTVSLYAQRVVSYWSECSRLSCRFDVAYP